MWRLVADACEVFYRMSKSKKEILYRLPDGTIATLEMKPVEQVLKDKGLDKAGSVQQFHTANVLRRIKRYMPFVTGMTYKVTVIQTNIRKPEIVTNTPYGKYLYYGKVMVGKAPRVVTNKNLVYSKTKNPLAGPFWDRALVANEGKALVADLQRYINSGR
jgi:hypothetical protein